MVYQVICKRTFNYLFFNKYPLQFRSPKFWVREYPYNQLCLNKKKRDYAKFNNELCNCY
jgi:hypothetical protein